MRDLMMIFSVLAALLLGACEAEGDPNDDDDDIGDDDDSTPEETVDELPTLENDCSEELNDSLDDAMGLDDANHTTYEDLDLCDGDVDHYAVDIPEGRWLSVELTIDEAGQDLDLLELNEEGEQVWGSVTAGQPYERLAFFNPGPDVQRRWLMVNADGNDASAYTLLIRRSLFHEGLDCDSFFPDEEADDESAPCNRIMQFPRDNGVEEGYFVEHEPHYSNLRREVIYVVREAALRTYEAFPDTNPIATLDMSERDGDTPGRMRGQLRHPEGTHVEGNDIDIAYYQTGEDNAGRPVCPHDNYFCTDDPILLDARRSAYFIVQLNETPLTRVIGVDPMIKTAMVAELAGLEDDGLITSSQRSSFTYKLASGDGWPFHQHHMHFSWSWEVGYERDAAPQGCMVGPGLY